MKRLNYAMLAVAAVLLTACNQPAQEAEVAEQPVVLETAEQRLSYGLAYNLGQRFKSDGVPVDVAAFVAGVQDALNGSPGLMSQEEMMTELQSYQQASNQQREAEMQQLAITNAEQGMAFLAENAQTEGVAVLESGLQYRELQAGSGASPSATDTVEVHYRGTLIDGTEFDSSYSRGETVKFAVNQVIPGWTEALQLMSVGSKWQLFIPAELAYGVSGGGPIGPNSTLIFDVELVGVEGAAAE
jgi:FKBP-type peptidyl-prolyl cis-trans isomerase